MKNHKHFSIIHSGVFHTFSVSYGRKVISGLTRYGIDHSDKSDKQKDLMEIKLRQAYNFTRRYVYDMLDTFVEWCM